MTTRSHNTPKVGYLWHTLYGWHDTGTGGNLPADPAVGLQPVNRHFSSPEPKRRLNELIEVSDLRDVLTQLSAKPASDEQVLRAHTADHLAYIREQSELPKGGDCGDGGSPFGRNAEKIGRLSAGGAIAVTKAVLDGKVRRAYGLINPPGHHAERERGLGFCLFNNASIAAAEAKTVDGIDRVAIVDWDVHHGNGTQDIWWDDPSVLTISVHQDRNFPVDSGFVTERGTGAGEGYNFNIPLAPGSGDAVYLKAMRDLILPALDRFEPGLIIVSSGYDAAMMDPLGRQMVTANGFKKLTEEIIGAAERLCDGKLVVLQEGGYCQYYVPFCGLAVMEALTETASGFEDAYADIVEGQVREVVDSIQQDYLDAAYDAHFKESKQPVEAR